MPSRPLSFEQQALIGLQASPYRLLTIEKADEKTIIAELLDEATEWPKRTKREVQRYGRGTPILRTDLISIALGWTLRQLREETAKWGADHYLYGERARLLRLVGERAGGRRRVACSRQRMARQVGLRPRRAPDRPLALCRRGGVSS